MEMASKFLSASGLWASADRTENLKLCNSETCVAVWRGLGFQFFRFLEFQLAPAQASVDRRQNTRRLGMCQGEVTKPVVVLSHKFGKGTLAKAQLAAGVAADLKLTRLGVRTSSL